MKKTIITILLCGALILGLTGCSKPNIGKESTTKIATDREIELSIKENTLSNEGATLVLTNNSDKDYMYGDSYMIQIKKDDKWYGINVEVEFMESLTPIKSGETKEMKQDWESVYGKLEQGTYRIIKNINYENEEGKLESFNLAVEFKVK